MFYSDTRQDRLQVKLMRLNAKIAIIGCLLIVNNNKLFTNFF